MLDDVKSWNGKKDLLQIITTVITKAYKMLIHDNFITKMLNIMNIQGRGGDPWPVL